MNQCPICLLDIESGNEMTTCGHKFHKNCLNHWLSQCPNKSCPVCRTTQPNYLGEIITYWDNVRWIIKKYIYGNIERQYYPNGFLKYEIIFKIDDPKVIIRSEFFSADGKDIYIHRDFKDEDIQRIRDGTMEIPNRPQIINFMYISNDLFNNIINDINEINEIPLNIN